MTDPYSPDQLSPPFRKDPDSHDKINEDLGRWVRRVLKPGRHYGRDNGLLGPTNTPLYLEGALAICGLLRVQPTFPELMDYELAVQRGERFEVINLRCDLVADGKIVGTGLGVRRVNARGDPLKALKAAMKAAMIDATLRLSHLEHEFRNGELQPPSRSSGGRSARNAGDEIVPAGPYKGFPWKEVPIEYVAWAAQEAQHMGMLCLSKAELARRNKANKLIGPTRRPAT